VGNDRQIREHLEARRDRIIALSHRIHGDPEPAFEEHRTSRLLREVLASEGFTVTPGAGGLATAFTALRGNRADGPRITFTAEMDALPEIGHACGHNIIAAAGVYAPIVLAAALGPQLPGTIQVIGTPAEERGSGKVALLEAGLFDGAGTVLQMHPHSMDTVICQAMARRTFTVECFGKAAHAAAAPQEGVNALDALVSFYQSASLARQQFPPGCLFHGIFEDGGRSVNVIPDYARGRFSLRAQSMSDLARLFDRIGAWVRGASEATGCRVVLSEVGRSVTCFKRNAALEELFAGLFESIGRTGPRKTRRSFGSTDLANVSMALPAIEILLKASDHPIHTEDFARDAAAEGGDRTLLDGVFLLAAGGYRLLTDPGLAVQVRQAFEAPESEDSGVPDS